MKNRIVIVGSSFAGYTAAVTLAKLLKSKHNITVIDRNPEFLFLPSFAWYPFGYRGEENLSFDTRPIYEKLGVEFIKAPALGFDLKDQLVFTPKEDIPYDYLVIATGTRARYESVKGLLPGENSWSICSLHHATEARNAWKDFLENPGPLVVGASQWASYFFAAYEFLLNAIYHIKQNGKLRDVPIHFITPEPYLGHFGIGGLYDDQSIFDKLFDEYNIQTHTNAEIHEVRKDKVLLEGGVRLASDFTMIIPQFIGIDPVRATRSLSNRHGLIEVTDEFYHPEYPNVYAAGGSVHIPQMDETPVALGVPRTHSSSGKMAKAVAYNILSDIEGGIRVSISKPRLYEYCREDMDYLGLMMFNPHEKGKDSLEFIAEESKEKWANFTMKKYIESSFDTDYLCI